MTTRIASILSGIFAVVTAYLILPDSLFQAISENNPSDTKHMTAFILFIVSLAFIIWIFGGFNK